ncbi:MAG: hypothetical protein HY287_16100 [Planctomycetes bacterium]|nr:hypothetical protein [Planctomycetota bacterium]
MISDPCVQVIEPICGCDGKSFLNECEVARVSVNLRSTGQCP